MSRPSTIEALMEPLKIAVISKTHYFDEYRAALVRIFKQIGCEAKAFEQLEYDYEPDCFLIINPFHFTKEIKYHDHYIFGAIQTEQIPGYLVGSRSYSSRYIRRMWRIYRQYDFMIEWSRASYEMLKSRYANIYHLPYGSFKEIEYTTAFLPPEEYDLCFIGDPSGIKNRRKNILAAISKRFKLLPHFTNLWGAERQQVIFNAKILLNIHYEQSLIFESPRFYECLANCRFLLSEPVHDSYPFVENQDYATFFDFNLFDRIEYYLSNVDERIRIAQAGHQKALRYRLDRIASHILQRIVIEKYQRMNWGYRLKDWLFHLSGIDWFKKTNVL